jgi:hypothetical protein
MGGGERPARIMGSECDGEDKVVIARVSEETWGVAEAGMGLLMTATGVWNGMTRGSLRFPFISCPSQPQRVLEHRRFSLCGELPNPFITRFNSATSLVIFVSTCIFTSSIVIGSHVLHVVPHFLQVACTYSSSHCPSLSSNTSPG